MVFRRSVEPVIIGPRREPLPVIRPAEMAYINITPSAASPEVIYPQERHPAITIAPQISRVITQPQRAVWDEYGWTQQRQGEYAGEYRVRDTLERERRFAGRIREEHGQSLAYIADPPPEIRNHRHGHCLQLWGQPEPGGRTWYHLHWSTPARDPDTALLYMEQMLDEAINNRR